MRVVGYLPLLLVFVTSCAQAQTVEPGQDAAPTTTLSSIGASTTTPLTPTKLAADTMVVTVLDGDRLDIEVSNGARLTTRGAAFSETTEVRLVAITEGLEVAAPIGFQVAGGGVHVDLGASQLLEPVTVALPASSPPSPEAVPLMVHIDDSGTAEVLAASFKDGFIVAQTKRFSGLLPGWFTADSIADWVSDLLTGRTDPPECPYEGHHPAPDYLTLLVPPSGAVHGCAVATGGSIVEINVQSNRGTYLVVRMPPGATYVWSDPPSDRVTRAFRHRGWVGQDEILLAPGARATAGYDIAESPERRVGTVQSTATTVILSALDAFLGDLLGAYSLVACVADPINLSLSLSSVEALVKCGVDLAGKLSDESTATAAVNRLYGPGLDRLSLADRVAVLRAQADRWSGFGKVFKVLGLFLKIGPIWSAVVDEAAQLWVSGADELSLLIGPNGGGGPHASIVDCPSSFIDQLSNDEVYRFQTIVCFDTGGAAALTVQNKLFWFDGWDYSAVSAWTTSSGSGARSDLLNQGVDPAEIDAFERMLDGS